MEFTAADANADVSNVVTWKRKRSQIESKGYEGKFCNFLLFKFYCPRKPINVSLI